MCLRLLQGRLQRGIYDTIQTAVDTIFVGRDRQCNRRFLRMSSHHLVDPVACTPASGLGRAAKRINGQVENQVGLVRERFFTPRPRFKIYDELNVWVKDKCIADVKTHAHPEQPDTTIWAAFGEERPHLMPCRGRSDGFHALPASVSRTCLGRFDNNKCSVCASAVGRPVEIQAYADRMVIRLNGRVVLNGHIVAEHARCRGRGETVYDPWHYVRSWPTNPALCVTERRSSAGSWRRHWERVWRKLAPRDAGRRLIEAARRRAAAMAEAHEVAMAAAALDISTAASRGYRLRHSVSATKPGWGFPEAPGRSYLGAPEVVGLLASAGAG